MPVLDDLLHHAGYAVIAAVRAGIVRTVADRWKRFCLLIAAMHTNYCRGVFAIWEHHITYPERCVLARVGCVIRTLMKHSFSRQVPPSQRVAGAPIAGILDKELGLQSVYIPPTIITM